MYGSECWELRVNDEKAMSVAEMKILRWSCGHTKLDRIKNEVILDKLKIRPIKDKMAANRLRWLGHIERRENEHICKKIRNWTVQGKGKQGNSKNGGKM